MVDSEQVSGKKKNVITSEDVFPNKKNEKPKTVKKPVDLSDNKTNNGKMIIVFESGAGYLTKSGFKFTQRNKIAELDFEEASRLLTLDNFRLPSDEEKQNFYNSKED
jgi:hypothetical protein